MTVFQYKAINTDGKEVTGSLDSPTSDAARSALESMHMEVLEIHEATRLNRQQSTTAPANTLSKSFAFEGKEPSGVIRRGTIQADNKFSAFSKLQHDQNLTLTMLSPVGVTPQFRDSDLENWQKTKQGSSVANVASPKSQKKTIQFADPEAISASTPKAVAATVVKNTRSYAPLTETLRLYSGWLLAWYALFVTLGYYVSERELPFSLPLVQSFYVSPLIFSFTTAIFLFLLLSSLHRAMRGGIVMGVLTALVGIAVFTFVRLSVS